MQLVKLLKIMSLVIVLSLVYINIQMRIIDLAYQEESYKHSIKSLVEENSNINYKILTLKSANNIGIKMLAENSDLSFGASENMRSIASVRILSEDLQPISQSRINSDSNAMLSFLSRR